MRGGNALGRAALSAKKDSDRKKSKPVASDSDSEDSDALAERLDKRQREKALQKGPASGLRFRKGNQSADCCAEKQK